MSTESIILIDLGNASQSQAEVLVNMRGKGGGAVGIKDTFVDGEFTIVDLSEE